MDCLGIFAKTLFAQTTENTQVKNSTQTATPKGCHTWRQHLRLKLFRFRYHGLATRGFSSECPGTTRVSNIPIDGPEIPKQPSGMYKNPENHAINYRSTSTYQLVQDFWTINSIMYTSTFSSMETPRVMKTPFMIEEQLEVLTRKDSFHTWLTDLHRRVWYHGMRCKFRRWSRKLWS